MLITKFNRMIRSKLIWGAVAVIVSLFFVLSSNAVRGCAGELDTPNAEARLYGELVTTPEFYRARQFELGLRDPGPLSDESQRHVRRQTFMRLAALRAAEEMGLSPADREMAAAIQRDPSFAVDGVFNRARYQAVVQQQLRVPVPTFEAYFRQDLALQKARSVLRACVWTPPTEVTEKLRNITDTFTLEYVALESTNLVPEVELTQAEVRAYYDANRETFRIPEKVSVRYAAFPVSNYLAAAEIEVKDLRGYYNDHLDDYAYTVTNNAAAGPATSVLARAAGATGELARADSTQSVAAAASTNVSVETVYTPFAEVTNDIRRVLAAEQARLLARDAATEMVIAMAPGRDSRALDMAEAAAQASAAVSTTDWFAAYEPIPDVDLDFQAAGIAFKLEAGDPERYFSDALMGDAAAYVLAAHEREPARVPDFTNVVDRVRPLAREQKRRETFVERVEALREELSEAIRKGTPFAQAAAGLDLAVTNTTPFAVYDGAPDDFEQSNIVVPEVMSLEQGALSKVIETPGGAVIAYIAARQPGDMATAQQLRPELVRALDRYRVNALFADWKEYLLKTGGFEDLKPIAPPDDRS